MRVTTYLACVIHALWLGNSTAYGWGTLCAVLVGVVAADMDGLVKTDVAAAVRRSQL